MSKKKMSLESLKVKSFITKVDTHQGKKIAGGLHISNFECAGTQGDLGHCIVDGGL